MPADDVPAEPVPGNTNSGTGNPCKKWCFTINNYNFEEVEELKLFCSKSSKFYIVGQEIGEKCNTPHLQGYIELTDKKRFSTLKNINCFKRAHLEKAKGSREDNIIYCSKEKVLFTNHKFPRKVKIINDLFSWQSKMEKILTTEENDRAVHWIQDIEGNNGKTQFMKYMISKYNCLFCCGGKRNDILNLCYNQKEYLETANPAIIIWDLPRDIDETFISYEAIEQLKNGIVVNMKYETGGFIINSPNLLILSNKMPIIKKLTSDRWHLHRITDKDLEDVHIEPLTPTAIK